MNGIPKPAIAASLTAAALSNRRLQSGKKKFTTSVSRARRLRAQACHVLQLKELHVGSMEKGAAHKSILNNPVIFKTLLTWAAEQKPGNVCIQSKTSFFMFNYLTHIEMENRSPRAHSMNMQ
jgi:hypothetical protein